MEKKSVFFFAFQKVTKTGNIGEKKSSGRWYRLCKIPQMQKVN